MDIPLPGSPCLGPAAGYWGPGVRSTSPKCYLQILGSGLDFKPDFRGNVFVPISPSQQRVNQSQIPTPACGEMAKVPGEEILASSVLVNACVEVCPSLLAWLETLDRSEMEFMSRVVPPCTGKASLPLSTLVGDLL